jgi:hypothetical protein
MTPNKRDKLFRNVADRWLLKELVFITITVRHFGDTVLINRVFAPLRDDSISCYTTNVFCFVVLEVNNNTSLSF